MTKKSHIPAGAKIDPAQDEFFERASIQGLKDIPSASDWRLARGIWLGLEECHPATRRRILAHALRLCSERQQPPPEVLVDCIEAELSISTVPRARPKDALLMAEAASYLVRNPRASYRKIAAALGRQDQAPTIYRMFEKAEFWSECAEQSARYDGERAHEILKVYVDRFGPLDYGTEETGFVALSSLVPFMIEALEGQRPPLSNEAVRRIAANQSAIRSEPSLKSRLMSASR